MPRDPLGVPDHRQQVPRGQRILAVVANAHLLGKQEGIDDGAAKLVAVPGLGTPVDPAVSPNALILTVDLPHRSVVQEAVGFLAKDILADHPTTVIGERRKIGVLAGKQIFVLDHVSVFKAQEFFRKRLGSIPR